MYLSGDQIVVTNSLVIVVTMAEEIKILLSGSIEWIETPWNVRSENGIEATSKICAFIRSLTPGVRNDLLIYTRINTSVISWIAIITIALRHCASIFIISVSCQSMNASDRSLPAEGAGGRFHHCQPP